ncbi:glycosyltransferase family 4 protein [Mycolicibacterium elephantis]|uniref:glycosyltransferase family 4 protein n=1 Tax=Mycolicibacterium elephantis TaxID=81858 RepID=UPI000FE22B76|nr:glycosyltransferase family 4 protein [Mycolicibacterium elephantis]MCV7220890.1 glycosyltransferase family 4 protein [Mycolicibacterium elephantis]
MSCRARERISILSLHYPPDATGVAPYAGALAAGLSRRAHRVTAYVAHPFYPEWKIRPGYGQWKTTENIAGVTVHRLRHYVPRPPRGMRRVLSELSLGVRLFFRNVSSASVAVAVSPALFATALVVLRLRLTPWRPRLVVWVQDIYTLGMVETKEGGGVAVTITKLVERFVLRSADRVVAIHPRFADYLSQDVGIERDRITVIRNWTHLEPAPEVSKADARARLSWPTDTLLAVHTGNMGAKQGLENVVEAARLADEKQAPIKFVLVGDGGERARLEQLARGIRRIEFIDPLSEADYRSALAAADCLLVNELPGVATMAVPSKLTSYFDAARPIVAATDPNGITAGEIEESRAGVVVPSGDPQMLLDTALTLLDDGDKAERYGAAGRRYRMEVLNADAAIEAFCRVIDEVVSEPAVNISRRRKGAFR